MDQNNFEASFGRAVFPKVHRVSDADRRYLQSLEPVLEGISRVFGEHCEVVLHSLEDLAHSIIAIRNGDITGRGIGAPVTNLALEVLSKALESDEDVIGPYFSTTDSGRSIKSVTTLLRNSAGRPIGFLCINIDLSVSLADIVRCFSPDSARFDATRAPVPEVYPLELNDLIHKALETELADVASMKGISAAEKNRLIIQALEQKHVFSVKGAVEEVAQELGISRHTVYSHLREIRRGEATEQNASGE